MNRRLFWKIFLPFWVAQALLLGALYLRLHYRLHSEHPWWIQPERQVMPQLGLDAAHDYERGGQPALDGFLNTISLKKRASYWLLDGDGQGTGRPIGARTVFRECQQALQSGGSLRLDDSSVVVSQISTPQGAIPADCGIRPAAALRARSRRHSVDAEARNHGLGAFLPADRALPQQAHRAPARRHPRAGARQSRHSRRAKTSGNRQDEIAELVRDFDSMADELRNSIQSERNLLSGVSHELRSPIARMRLALTLARGADARERREMLDRIEQDTIQLDSMLERILTVARLESGQHKPKFETVSLNDIVDDVLHDAKFEATPSTSTYCYAGAA